jgi:hypothetical protein
LDFCQQVLSFQVGANIIIGKSSALVWTSRMDRTPFHHPVICLKDAGSIIFHLKSIAVFHETLADLPIGDKKISGQTVYVISINQQ